MHLMAAAMRYSQKGGMHTWKARDARIPYLEKKQLAAHDYPTRILEWADATGTASP
jgi:hypothetical protein